METIRTFTADNEADLWQQVAADLAQGGDVFEYSAELNQRGYRIQLDIDIDLGGGFESGLETTTFTALVPGHVPFRFALHEQDWVHEIGKLLGLTDVVLGDPEIDAAYIITTNDAPVLHDLLADPALRQTLLRYQELRLSLAPRDHEPNADVLLTFYKEQGIVDPVQLQEIYHLVFTLLQQIAPLPANEAGLQ
jgi:hypothetical protein